MSESPAFRKAPRCSRIRWFQRPRTTPGRGITRGLLTIAGLRQIPTAPNPNRLAGRENLLDQNRFIQQPTSTHRYNFQFSDNEIRSVQGALRRLGIYSGQVDGILGPDTRRAIEDYQLRNKRPVTGQPDQSLNALLGIF